MSYLIVTYRKNTNKKDRLEIKHLPFIIGRVDSNDLVLPKNNISRKHARINKLKGDYTIEDLKSSNGTFINYKPVQKPTKLKNGDIITIGDFIIQFELDEQEIEESTGIREEKRQKVKKIKSKDQKPATKKEKKEKEIEKPVKKKVLTAEQKKKEKQWEKLKELKHKIHDLLVERMDLKKMDIRGEAEDELKERTRKHIAEIIKEFATSKFIPSWIDKAKLRKDILNEALGLGPLEDLLEDPTITEIMVNSADQVFIERNGKLVLSDIRFADDQQVLLFLERIIAPLGRRIDESMPMVDARLKDGSRVNAIIPPLSLNGPMITIRKFSEDKLTVEDLVNYGSFTNEVAEFLEACVRVRKNILISGGTGSGKTTFLNLLSSYIPSDERILTIEDAAELSLPQIHVGRLEARPPNIEGTGAIPIRELVRNSLRMRPDRIVIGECRGGEALDMLQAMNTGHDGSLTTLHANSPSDALLRLETMVMMSGMDLPSRAIREQISSAVDIIVQQSRFSDGSRKNTYISEVIGINREDGSVITRDIFIFQQTGLSEDGKVLGYYKATGYIPPFVEELKIRGIKLNMNIFNLGKEYEEEQRRKKLNQEKQNQMELNQEELNQEELNQEELNQEELNQMELNQEELNQEELNQEEQNQEE